MFDKMLAREPVSVIAEDDEESERTKKRIKGKCDVQIVHVHFYTQFYDVLLLPLLLVSVHRVAVDGSKPSYGGGVARGQSENKWNSNKEMTFARANGTLRVMECVDFDVAAW